MCGYMVSSLIALWSERYPLGQMLVDAVDLSVIFLVPPVKAR